VIDLGDLLVQLEAAAGKEALSSRCQVAVRAQAGRTVMLTVGLTDIRIEHGIVILIGDLDEVDD
jgi:hypothetical protein